MRPVSLRILRSGACRQFECMADRGGLFVWKEFPALCGLIRHPEHGWILYDTGYAEHFFAVTAQWPERLYCTALPVSLPPSESLKLQLAGHGIAPEDIHIVIVSHYHGDHIAGLRDFPKARFVALSADTRALNVLQGHPWKATFKAQLHGLLPSDFFSRLSHVDARPACSLPPWLAPFDRGFDVLGDGSLIGVPLPGHSHGQLGLFLPDADGQSVFLVADACWSVPACRAGRLPSRLALLASANRQHYRDTFLRLRTLALREPSVSLVPSHCSAAWRAFDDANG